jgi:hypothetical protein
MASMKEAATSKRFLKVADLADVLNCSRSKAYEIVKSGAVRSVVISGLLRVPVEALDALAAGDRGSEQDEAPH